jgi:hypothetical protein
MAEAPAWIQEQVAAGNFTPIFGGIAEKILGTKTDVEIPDFHIGGSRPADKVLTAWDDRLREIDGKNDSMEKELELSGHVPGYDHTRDLHFVGRTGSILAGRHQPGRVSEAAFLVGAAHANVGRHLDNMSVRVTQPDLQDKPLSDFERSMIEWNTNVRFDPEDLLQLYRNAGYTV